MQTSGVVLYNTSVTPLTLYVPHESTSSMPINDNDFHLINVLHEKSAVRVIHTLHTECSLSTLGVSQFHYDE